MNGFRALVRTQWRLLRREPGYWITSIGLAAIIIIVYGSVLSNPGGPELGVVLEDDSPALAEGVDELASIDGIHVETGPLESEFHALESGDRWAVIVFPQGTIDNARNGQEASARVVYNDASPFEATAGQGILREFVAEVNRTLGVALELDVTVQTIDAGRGIGLLETLFPGLIGMSLMLGNSLAASMFVSWRQAGILKRISSSPINPFTMEVAQFVTLLVISALQVTVLVTLAQVLFDINVAGSCLTLATVSAIGAVAFMGIWYALAALITNPTSFFATMNLAAFAMMFLGGSVVPNEDVPSWLNPLIEALPLTHLNDALRSVINDAADLSSVAGQLAILAAWAVAGFALSARLFRWGRA
jgi:ABC-2 type transport system permease protein